MIPIFFAIIDGVGYRSESPATFLRGIAVLNSLYTLASLSLTYQHRDSVTTLGWLYIVVEVAIVAGLAVMQWRTAGRLRSIEGI